MSEANAEIKAKNINNERKRVTKREREAPLSWYTPRIKAYRQKYGLYQTLVLLLYAGATDGTSRRLPLHRTAKVGIISETAKEIFKKYLIGNFSRFCQHFRKFVFFNDTIAITLQ